MCNGSFRGIDRFIGLFYGVNSFLWVLIVNRLFYHVRTVTEHCVGGHGESFDRRLFAAVLRSDRRVACGRGVGGRCREGRR